MVFRMVVNPSMVDNFVLIINVCGRDFSFFLVVFLCCGFRSPFSPLLCFITVVLIICVSLYCFTDKVDDPYAD